jgi:hypothetical protein
MRRPHDTRLARAVKTNVPHDLKEPRRRSLLRARAALATLLREEPQPDPGPALAGALRFGEAAADQLAAIPDTALLREMDEARLFPDRAGVVEEALEMQLLRLVLQYRDGREVDAANASPAELLAARLAGASTLTRLAIQPGGLGR